MHSYLDAHQIKAVEALFELKRICDKHDIRFYLLAGTTLGAVRHEGMIPWDDDVDVGLLLEDLHKLQAVIKDELNPKLGFEYASLEAEPGFPRLFGKILYNRQSCVDLFLIAKWTNNDLSGHFHWNITRFCVESYYHSIGYTKPTVAKKVELPQPTPETANAQTEALAAVANPENDTSAPDFEADGDLYSPDRQNPPTETELDAQQAGEDAAIENADLLLETAVKLPLHKRVIRKIRRIGRHIIGPASVYDKNIRKYKRRIRKLRKLAFRHRIRTMFNGKRIKKEIRFIIYKCCFFLKTEDYVRLARWNEDYYGRHGYDCYANIYSIYGMKKERIRKEWIENTSYVTFEGEQFMTVGDTDAYLTHLYGDYMQLPPEEKRVKARHAEVYQRKA